MYLSSGWIPSGFEHSAVVTLLKREKHILEQTLRHSGEEEEVSLADFPAEANRMNWNEKMSEYCPRAAAPLWEVKGGEKVRFLLSISPRNKAMHEMAKYFNNTK